MEHKFDFDKLNYKPHNNRLDLDKFNYKEDPVILFQKKYPHFNDIVYTIVEMYEKGMKSKEIKQKMKKMNKTKKKDQSKLFTETWNKI